ncbi:nucleotide-diphospho-sugar transferase, partial [Winogradskyella sp.]|nr:nucleotide-diphospho-sugar transferase [Winogradskyella sp.]
MFRDCNLGCRRAVSDAITWFFEQVEMGIILEDDCLPDLSFFPYADKLLNKYQHDLRIFSISGTNYNIKNISEDYSYFFSKYVSIWCWATWKNRWEHYSKTEKNIDTLIESSDSLRATLQTTKETKLRLGQLKGIKENRIDTWDYIWSLTCLFNNGLTIIPKKNLVINIGFDSHGTHTMD